MNIAGRRTLPTILATLTGAAGLAACGSGAAPTGTSGNGSNNTPRLLSFVSCVRSHGIPNLPDPGASPSAAGAGSGPVVSLMGVTFPRGITPQSPAFRAAMQSCKHLLPNGGTPPPVSASQRKQAIAAAQCMRTHGVPDFPDPVFPAHGGIGIRAGPGVNPQSPAVEKAAQTSGTV
jgi:hypothetical protein